MNLQSLSMRFSEPKFLLLTGGCYLLTGGLILAGELLFDRKKRGVLMAPGACMILFFWPYFLLREVKEAVGKKLRLF